MAWAVAPEVERPEPVRVRPARPVELELAQGAAAGQGVEPAELQLVVSPGAPRVWVVAPAEPLEAWAEAAAPVALLQ